MDITKVLGKVIKLESQLEELVGVEAEDHEGS